MNYFTKRKAKWDQRVVEVNIQQLDLAEEEFNNNYNGRVVIVDGLKGKIIDRIQDIWVDQSKYMAKFCENYDENGKLYPTSIHTFTHMIVKIDNKPFSVEMKKITALEVK